MADGTGELPRSDTEKALRDMFARQRAALEALLLEPDGLFRVFGLGFCAGAEHVNRAQQARLADALARLAPRAPL